MFRLDVSIHVQDINRTKIILPGPKGRKITVRLIKVTPQAPADLLIERVLSVCEPDHQLLVVHATDKHGQTGIACASPSLGLWWTENDVTYEETVEDLNQAMVDAVLFPSRQQDFAQWLELPLGDWSTDKPN